MSLTDLTTHAAWITGLAMFALVCLGWRKTARATPKIPRGARPARAGFAMSEVAVPSYRRTPVWRRVWALGGTGFLTVLSGAIIAIVIAFAVSLAVTTLSDLLKR